MGYQSLENQGAITAQYQVFDKLFNEMLSQNNAVTTLIRAASK